MASHATDGHAARADGFFVCAVVRTGPRFFADVVTDRGVASGGLIAAAYELQPTSALTADTPAALALFVDTSVSRAPGFAPYVARVRMFINALATRYPGITVAKRGDIRVAPLQKYNSF